MQLRGLFVDGAVDEEEGPAEEVEALESCPAGLPGPGSSLGVSELVLAALSVVVGLELELELGPPELALSCSS